MGIAALCWAVCAYAEEGRCAIAADDRAIRQVAEDWTTGYDAGDAAKVAASYAEDSYYLTQHFVSGILRGREEMSCSGHLAYTVGRYLANERE